ncbi:MAG: hypothetical protein K2W96_22095 [Gemmataceae bacterium]|nr:hypothetical protein [Gemmataceae bacterium]
MTCPLEIARIVVLVMRKPILAIRAAGWDGDAGRCADLADHLHNLPELLLGHRADLLQYYLDCMCRDRRRWQSEGLESLWAELDALAGR